MERIDRSKEMVKENSLRTKDDLPGMNFAESPETITTTGAIPNLRNRRRSYGNLRKNLRQLFQLCPRLARTMKR